MDLSFGFNNQGAFSITKGLISDDELKVGGILESMLDLKDSGRSRRRKNPSGAVT
tara:strand:- start:775 stop:939 length:165 start_codon:yes stop_codon:yes gene_type:complete